MAHRLKKVFLYTLPTIFLMSHIIFVNNASAIQPVFDVSNYDLYRFVGNTEITCELGGAVTQTLNGYSCNFNNTSTSSFVRLYDIRTQNSYSVKAGDLINFHIFIRNDGNKIVNFMPILSYFGHTSTDFRIRDFSVVANEQEKVAEFYNGVISGNQPPYIISLDDVYANLEFYSVYSVTLEAVSDYNGPVYLRGSNNDTAALFLFPGINTAGNTGGYKVFLGSFQFLRRNESQENKEVEDKTNAAVQESESQGNDSQTDTDTATQSLMTAGANIISALTSAPATDCNINISTTGNSSAFTSAIGNLNLCSDVPSGVLTLVQGMVALVFTPIVLYYVYSILTLIYAQFKEYNS